MRRTSSSSEKSHPFVWRHLLLPVVQRQVPGKNPPATTCGDTPWNAGWLSSRTTSWVADLRCLSHREHRGRQKKAIQPPYRTWLLTRRTVIGSMGVRVSPGALARGRAAQCAGFWSRNPVSSNLTVPSNYPRRSLIENVSCRHVRQRCEAPPVGGEEEGR